MSNQDKDELEVETVTTATTRKDVWEEAAARAGFTLEGAVQHAMDGWVDRQAIWPAEGHEPEPPEPPKPEPPIEPPVTPPVTPPIQPPAIHPPGNDIREILEMYPDTGGTVVVKAGEYTSGPGVFPHAKPLVVVAEHPGQVMLNFTNADLTLDPGSTNIVLAGLMGRNGTIMCNGDDITLWYHDGSFPIEVWHQMYLAALGGTDQGKTDQQKKDAIQRMTHPVCKAWWVGMGAGRQLKHNRVLGSDIHDCGDDGVFFGGCDGVLVQGTRVWNIDEKGMDPNVNPWRPNSDMFHNDAVQVPGGVSEFLVADSYVQCILQLGGDNGSFRGALRNLWVAGCNASGAVVISQNNLFTNLKVEKVVGFSNGHAFPHDEGWNTFMTQFCDGRQIIKWGTTPVTTSQGGAVSSGRFMVPNRMLIEDLGGNSDMVIPPQFQKADWNPQYLADKLAPKDDPQNPALVWRRANPFENWQQFVPK